MKYTGKHIVFFINYIDSDHSFWIEKKRNWFRIYQSIATQYTLGEWLGITKWSLAESSSDTQQQKQFGGGKKLSMYEIMKFLVRYEEVIVSIRMYILNVC